jgi:hypothetical protein
MSGAKLVMVVALLAAFCTGYLLSHDCASHTDISFYAPRIIVINIEKSGDRGVACQVDGKGIVQNEIAEFLRDAALDSGFYGGRIEKSANCRLVITTKGDIRWTNIASLIYSAERNGIVDVYLGDGRSMLPIRNCAYSLNPYHNWPKVPLKEVYLSVRMKHKGRQRQADPAKGELSITIREVEFSPPFKKPIKLVDGGEIIGPEEEEERTKRTSNWETASGLIPEVAGRRVNQHVKVLIIFGPMVPVREVINAMSACRYCRGGYEIVAPEVPY